MAQRNNDTALAAVEKVGNTKVIQLNAEDKLACRKTLSKVHRQPEGRIPKELIERIYQETGYRQAMVSMR